MTTRRLPDVVAMISAGNGMGKTLAADYLVRRYDYTKLSFAAPLKDMLRTMFLNMRFTDYEIRTMIAGAGKEKPILGLNGVTPRDLMISLGTGWGREMVYQGLWCDVVQSSIVALLDQGARVVIDDTRFRNERFMLSDITEGKVQFTEIRRNVPINPGNEVGDLNVKFTANVLVENNGTLAQLYRGLDVTLLYYEEHFSLRLATPKGPMKSRVS